MQHSYLLPNPFPQRLLFRLEGFADLFTRPAWSNVLLLLADVVLAPGRRTVTAALRILVPLSHQRQVLFQADRHRT